MELRLWFEGYPPLAGLEPRAARSVFQRLTYRATGGGEEARLRVDIACRRHIF